MHVPLVTRVTLLSRLGISFSGSNDLLITTRALLSRGDGINNMIVFLLRTNFAFLLLENVCPIAVVSRYSTISMLEISN